MLGPDWEHADTIAPIQFVQGEHTIRLSPKQIRSLPFLHASKAPELTERAPIFFTGTSELDPTEPFTLRLLLSAPRASAQPAFAAYDLTYRIPRALSDQAGTSPRPGRRQRVTRRRSACSALVRSGH
jgi:transcriptional regulator of nitric oxide reductase